MGKLEEKRFELLCAEYEKEQAELEQLLASEQAQLDQFHEDTDRASHFLALAQKYTDFTELTAPMIHEFVEKILVHAPDRSTGERVQEIEIYLNFIGKFEVPMPEPTEEELAAEEKRRQKRIRDLSLIHISMAAVTLPLSCKISSSLNCKNASSRLTQSAIYMTFPLRACRSA